MTKNTRPDTFFEYLKSQHADDPEWLLAYCEIAPETARECLIDILNLVAEGEKNDGCHLSRAQCRYLADCLTQVLNGVAPEKAFNLSRRSGAPDKVIRDCYIALDYYYSVHLKKDKASAAQHAVCERWRITDSTFRKIRSGPAGILARTRGRPLPEHLKTLLEILYRLKTTQEYSDKVICDEERGVIRIEATIDSQKETLEFPFR